MKKVKVKTKESLTRALLSKLRTETVAVIHSAYEDSPRTVALVNVDKSWSKNKKLEKAFMLTNSVEDAWYTNEEVVYIGSESSCRSTSVGDIVRFEDGKKFKCENTGWVEL
tara:strand:- start:197 stop:529 length:333 start_codon:yes stop_codon:yes gene_type:complete